MPWIRSLPPKGEKVTKTSTPKGTKSQTIRRLKHADRAREEHGAHNLLKSVSRIKRKLNRPITDEHEQAALGEIKQLIHFRSQLQFVKDIESSIYATQRQMDLSLDKYIAQQREAASIHIR